MLASLHQHGSLHNIHFRFCEQNTIASSTGGVGFALNLENLGKVLNVLLHFVRVRTIQNPLNYSNKLKRKILKFGIQLKRLIIFSNKIH